MIRIDDRELRVFADQLRDFPREMRRELRPRLRSTADDLVAQVRTNASWSKRIPGAVGVRVSFAGGRTGGVQVRVDSRKAPHARPLEGGSSRNRGYNRHPVFGTDTWVNQPTRPFFFPAAQRMQPAVVRAVQEVIDNAWSDL